MTTRHPDDDLLLELGARVRAEDAGQDNPDDALWSKRVRGTASDDELAALEDLISSDDEAAYRDEAFRPLGNDFKQRLAADALQRLRFVPSTEEALSEPLTEESPLESLPRRRAPRRSLASAWRPLAMAAGILLMVGSGTFMWRQGQASDSDPMQVAWATSRTRSEAPGTAAIPSSTLRLRPSDDLFLTAQVPSATGVPDSLVSVFLRDDGGAVWPLLVAHEVRRQGAIELQLSLEDLPAHLEKGTLVVSLHGTRRVTPDQVMGSWRGRLQDALYGPWQRVEQEVIFDDVDDVARVEFSGCDQVLGPVETPRCVVSEDTRLLVWIRVSDPSAWVLRHGASTWPVDAGDRSEDGYRFELSSWTAQPPVESLDVVPSRPDVGRDDGWQLRLKRAVDESSEVDDLADLARQAFKAEQFERVAELLEQSAEVHGQEGALSAQIDDLTLLFYTQFELLADVLGAKETLDSMPEPAVGDADSAYFVGYYRGVWALESGELREALHHLGETARRAERMGWMSRHHKAEQLMARLLRQLGRGAESRALLERLVEDVPQLEDCEKVRVLNNLAWDQLLDLEAQTAVEPGDVASTLKLLEDSLRWSEQCDRDVGWERVNVHINLALAHVHAQDVPRAEHHLEQIEALTPSLIPRFWVWKVDIESRLALLADRPADALSKSRRLRELAADGLWLEAGWRGAVGEARAHLALGDPAAAQEAFGEAETWLDEQSRRVPLDMDRDTALEARGRSTAEYVDLLLRQGAAERAFEVARRARGRIYQQRILGAAPEWLDDEALASWIATVRRYRIEQAAFASQLITAGAGSPIMEARRLREIESLALAATEPLARNLAQVGLDGDWQLPPLAVDELVLLYHPLPGDWWVGFAAHRGRLETHRVDLAQVLDDPAGLVAPFTHLLKTAKRVRVLPLGPLNNVDFHALDVQGRPLAWTLPVVYGLDLPQLDALPDPASRRALLLAAPSGDLPAAEEEVDEVRRALDGWRAEPLALASPQELLVTLADSDLLHFAGHADFAGRDGLTSHLRLAGGTRLTAKDLLAARGRVPPVVVLSACSSARSTTRGTSPGLGLAQAFLLRGSRMIIGATRPVDDRLTRVFFGHLYGVWDGTADDLPQALRQAQLELHGLDEEAWSSFRLLMR